MREFKEGYKGYKGDKGDKGDQGYKGAQGERIYRGDFQGFASGKCQVDYLEGDIVKFTNGKYYRLESMPTNNEPPCTDSNKPTAD